MTREECLLIRRQLYETQSLIGAASETEPQDETLLNAYQGGTVLLDNVEEHCIKMGWLDAETLEEL